MAFIIEDGNQVEGAVSYASVKQLRDYADARGQSLPEDDTSVEHLLVRATDFIETHRFKGRRLNQTQPLEWPRCDVWVKGQRLDDSVIPRRLIRAVCEAAILAQDIDFMSPSEEPTISSETVGPINVQYAVSASNPWEGPSYPSVTNLLSDFIPAGLGVEVVRG